MSHENQNINNEQKAENQKNKNKEALKFILIILAVFCGTFAAVYTIVDLSMYRLGLKPFFTIAKEFDKMMDDEFKYMNKYSPSPVKIETKDNKYIVTVDLKTFGNNADNAEVTIENNGIKIQGKYKQDSNNSVKENNFYQNVIFPNEIKADQVKKEVKRNKITVTIPF